MKPMGRFPQSLEPLQFDDQLAVVLPSVEHRNRSGSGLDTFLHVLTILQLSLADPAGERRNGLFIPWSKVGGEKALHDRALYEEMPLRPRSHVPGIPARI